MTTAIPLVSSAVTCVVGHDPIVTLRREDVGDSPELCIEVGRDYMIVRALTRHRDPIADLTRYHGKISRRGRSTAMIITVNCGTPQPYLELCHEQSSDMTTYRVTVPITHEQQDRILALADPLSQVVRWATHDHL